MCGGYRKNEDWIVREMVSGGYDDGFCKGLMEWFVLMGSERSVSMGMKNRYEYG